MPGDRHRSAAKFTAALCSARRRMLVQTDEVPPPLWRRVVGASSGARPSAIIGESNLPGRASQPMSTVVLQKPRGLTHVDQLSPGSPSLCPRRHGPESSGVAGVDYQHSWASHRDVVAATARSSGAAFGKPRWSKFMDSKLTHPARPDPGARSGTATSCSGLLKPRAPLVICPEVSRASRICGGASHPHREWLLRATPRVELRPVEARSWPLDLDGSHLANQAAGSPRGLPTMEPTGVWRARHISDATLETVVPRQVSRTRDPSQAKLVLYPTELRPAFAG